MTARETAARIMERWRTGAKRRLPTGPQVATFITANGGQMADDPAAGLFDAIASALTAEREAGRREGLEEAAKVAAVLFSVRAASTAPEREQKAWQDGFNTYAKTACAAILALVSSPAPGTDGL